jgi:hypothetical protein
MTPKEKANNLVERYFDHIAYNKGLCRDCSLIAVDEIMDALEKNGSWNSQYWDEVKQELEKL